MRPAAPPASRLRVVHVINAMHLGGAEFVVLEHVRHAGPGVESWVCATRSGGPALEEAQRLGAHTIVLAGPGGRLRSLWRLADLLRRERVDVVNGHNPAGGFYAAVAGRMAGVPAIVRTEHSIRHPGHHPGLVLYNQVLEPTLTAMTHRVVCVCDAVRRGQLARTPWATKRLVTIPNGISEAVTPAPRQETRTALGLAPEDFMVLTVASLTPAKAQHVLLEAFARVVCSVPAARLFLAGDGALRAALEEQAARLGVAEHVRFLGVRQDVPALLVAADVFVLSSAREGLSLSLLEAMRAGRPAVVTDAGGNREVVAHGSTGFVVPRADAAALAEGLVALAADRARLDAWGRAARRRWEERYTAEHMVRDTEDLYRALAPVREVHP